MENNIPNVPATHPFEAALESLINKHCMENESDTPDFILARYIFTCLAAYKNAVKARDDWFGVDMWSHNKLKNQDPESTNEIENPNNP